MVEHRSLHVVVRFRSRADGLQLADNPVGELARPDFAGELFEPIRVDERRFAVLLSGVGLATAHSRMEGLRRQCATQLVVIDGQEFGFTISMGVASYPHTAHTQDEVMAACDAALLEARKRGGNNVALAAIRFGT